MVLSAHSAWLLASQALLISHCCADVLPVQQIAASKQQVAPPSSPPPPPPPGLSTGTTVQMASDQTDITLESDAVPADHGHAPEFNVSTYGVFPSPSRNCTPGACESVCAMWHHKDAAVARGASW